MHQRRTNQVLNNLAADPIEYEAIKQDDGFYIFSFPGADEYDFKEIVNKYSLDSYIISLTYKNDKDLTILLYSFSVISSYGICL